MFKAWNIINNLVSGYTIGHVLWEPKLLVEELRHRGMEARVLGHSTIKADDFPDARVIRAFQLHHKEPISLDPDWGFLENFVVHHMPFEKALGRLDRSLFDDASRPRAAMMLQGQSDWSAANPALDMYARIWAGRSSTFKQRVKLRVRSDMSAANYEPVFRVRPHVLPSILSPTEREIQAAKHRNGLQTGPLIVSFLAGARPERGQDLFPMW